MNNIQTQRTPDIIGAEIRGLTQQAKSMTLWFGIEIGRRLTEAKALLEHGQWLPYLKEQTEFSQPSASRLMRLSEAGLKAEKLKAKIKNAEEKAAASAAELEKLKKSQTLADPNTAVFKQIFEQVQEDFNKLHGSLLKVRASDPDTAQKLSAAVRALVGKMEAALNEQLP